MDRLLLLLLLAALLVGCGQGGAPGEASASRNAPRAPSMTASPRLAPDQAATAAVETPEALALRFVQAVTVLRDREQALDLLCADGYQYHKVNTESQIEFWSRPDVIVPPHDLRVVRSTLLPGDLTGGRDIYKVWVAFRYTYLFQGVQRDIDNEDGWAINVEENSSGYCASPWAGG